jgi:large subunit ribosomal protein L7/L12
MADTHDHQALQAQIDNLVRRLTQVESQLAALSANGGLAYTGPGPYAPTSYDAPPGLPGAVVELAMAGKKIEAIKLYREMTGAGLKEAKSFVDSL